MNGSIRNTALVLTLALLVGPTCLRAELIRVEDPLDTWCVTSPSSAYQLVEGRLVPEKGLFSFFPDGAAALEPQLHHGSTMRRGDAMGIGLAISHPIDELRIRIVDEQERTITESRGFMLEDGERGQIWYAIIGAPSDAPGGAHRLLVHGRDADRWFVYIETLTIEERQFASEDIVLDRQLTELRTKPDPQKTQESRELWEILMRFVPESVFCRDKFTIPLSEGRITAQFGDMRTYIYYGGGESRSIHGGVDIAAQTGTPVQACARGKVVLAENRKVTGNTVCIEHLPGVYSLYYHMSELLVENGQVVEKAALIGRVGQSGLATGPHLHWEIRVSGVAVDPWIFAASEIIDTSPIVSRMEAEAQQ